jgi:hypothetical protein
MEMVHQIYACSATKDKLAPRCPPISDGREPESAVVSACAFLARGASENPDIPRGARLASAALPYLVKFPPFRTGRRVEILLSEPTAYEFLRGLYNKPTEMHYESLMLREEEYRTVVLQKRFAVAEHRRASG